MNDFAQVPLSLAPVASRRRVGVIALLGGLAIITQGVGCTLWRDGKERTSIITPSLRASSIREMGPRAADATEADRARMCEQLAQQIRTEPDPIVRLAIQETMGQFQTPLAHSVILAGLNDDDRDVRVACCRLLGERAHDSAVGPLSNIVATDSDIDVRLAAVDALGKFKTQAAVPGLAAALKDRDPAMQYAGVEAMKGVTGEEELGNDVQAWRQYADRVLGGAGNPTAIATQPSADIAVK